MFNFIVMPLSMCCLWRNNIAQLCMQCKGSYWWE